MRPASRTLRVLTLALCCAAIPMGSQAQWLYEIQDSVIVSRIVGGDTVPAHKFAAAYMVQGVFDSTITDYTLTEVARNGQKLYLNNWQLDADHLDWSDSALTANSTTAAFAIATGDTVSFYREFQWLDVAASDFDTTMIIEDTLDFAVEMVNAATGSRSALLDSFGVNRRATRGVPVYHGNGPVMRLCAYEVPSGLNGQTVFLRLRAYSRGSGEHYLVRRDQFTVGLSDKLTLPSWSTYREYFNGSFGKRRVSDLEHAVDLVASGARLSVVPAVTDAAVEISFSVPGEDPRATITIYNSLGELVFVPMANAPTSTGATAYRFDARGTYFAVLSSHGQQLAVARIRVR